MDEGEWLPETKIVTERRASPERGNQFEDSSSPCLRSICKIVNTALRDMDSSFVGMYAPRGRESIPPEQLLRGLILQVLCGLRSNETHQSYTDPDSRLVTTSSRTGAVPVHRGQVLTENRNGLVVDACLTQAGGSAEREVALDMLSQLPGERRKTVGADEACDTGDLVAGWR
ncbi:MAG: hypothetical protein IT480_16680 [Gammaproteobacteria bacterium]|nr:hypothetical protein [Gammaproteobacteria bacterium]